MDEASRWGWLMMMVLLDEPTLMLFDSPEKPPDSLEAVDVLNGEYSFCDDAGRRHEGVVSRPGGWFRPPAYSLRPVGAPDLANVLHLVERAEVIEPNAWYADLGSLRADLNGRRQSRMSGR